MTRKLLLAVSAFLLSAFSASAAGCGVDADSLFVFRHGGMERHYRLYVPDSLAAGRPLVVMLHGYGGHASPERFGILDAARRYGFAACFPQGAADARGKACWNVGYPFQEGLRTDDVDFICCLVRYLVSEYGLDARNVFCTGHSNGGEMCYLMAYRKPDVFAAVAPIAGLTLEWMYRELEAVKPVPLMELHGTADRTSLWCGDPCNEGGWGAYIAVPLAAGYWAAANRCTYEETEELPLCVSGLRVTAHRYRGGAGGSEVWLYEIEGGSHSWSDDVMDTGAEIWKFFSMYVSE